MKHQKDSEITDYYFFILFFFALNYLNILVPQDFYHYAGFYRVNFLKVDKSSCNKIYCDFNDAYFSNSCKVLIIR